MKSIGVIGGMGPLATVDMVEKIIHNTRAQSDQEHIRVLVDSNPAIPDRTAAILYGGDDPFPYLVRSAILLENMGADMLLIACNTAHYYYERLLRFVRTPILHMPEETAKAAAAEGYGAAGLLATDGTVRAGIYRRAFEKHGVRLVEPDEEGQRAVMSLIYDGIKAGRQEFYVDVVLRALKRLQDGGAEVFVLGCTELPLAFKQYGIAYASLDPAEVVARRAVELAGGMLR